MNCHRARQLISPYLDQQLTGREMLALQQHFSECASCEAERRSIRQVKTLLRGLHEPRPRADLPGVIAVRLSEAEQPLWRVLSLPVAPSSAPRGRRLATALALSCLTVLSFAATCFAPASRDGALTASRFLLPMGSVPGPMNEASLTPLAAAPRPDFLLLTNGDGVRRDRLFTGQYETPAQPDLRLSPLPYETSAGYPQGQATFAGYRTR